MMKPLEALCFLVALAVVLGLGACIWEITQLAMASEGVTIPEWAN